MAKIRKIYKKRRPLKESDFIEDPQPQQPSQPQRPSDKNQKNYNANTSHIQGAGNLNIFKGYINNIQFTMFDSLPDCNERCIMFNSCTVKAVNNNIEDTEKCEIKKRYMNAVLSSLKEGLPEQDVMTVHKMGILLLPLYQQLISFKLAEYAMDTESGMINNVFIKSRINPVYKEIRAVIKMINDMLNEMSIEGSKAGYEKGDGDYYDTLFEAGETPM